jgi:Zn-dependent metalloprotease
MKVFVTAFLFGSMLLAHAQKNNNDYSPVQYKTNTCRSSFTKVQLTGKADAESIARYLKENIPNLKDYRTGLKLNYVNQSPGGYHFAYTQLFNGVPVYQSEVKVNIDRNNVIRSLFDNTENTANWNVNTADATTQSVLAINPATGKPMLCQRVINAKDEEQLIANGEIIFSRDTRAYAAHDTTASGKVFNPDPLTSAQVNYGAPYYDNNNANNAQLEMELQVKQFTTSFDTGTFSLVNQYVRMADWTSPITGVPTSNNGQFNYDRSQNEFEYINAFYHINTVQSHIHNLGFNCADALIEVDAHVTNDDQSFFTPASQPRLSFGDGCVDDAEDADVIVHEYGHSVSENASPNSNYGTYRNALDEGFGDYMAGSYSASISNFHSDWVFNWDGHNECWNGRILTTPDVYPIQSSSIYRNGQIWSACLWCLHNTIGRAATDSLILETHYSYTGNMSMPDAAQLLMESDTVLTGGKYACDIYRCLFNHGLQPQNPFIRCSVGINETETLPVQFQNHGNSFTLLNPQNLKAELQLRNIQGQLLYTTETNQATYNYQNAELPAGIYLVTLQGKGLQHTFRWSKF